MENVLAVLHQFWPPSCSYDQEELILGSLDRLGVVEYMVKWPIRMELTIRDFCLPFAQTVDEPVFQSDCLSRCSADATI